jgi:hypothetical protein
MINAIVAAISFYLFPLLVGRAIILLLKQEKKLVFHLIDYFIIGSLVLFLLTFLAPLTSTFPHLLRLIYLLAIILNLPRLNSSPSVLKKYKFGIVWTLLLGTLIYGLWRLNTIIPLPLNWDFLHHQTLVNQINAGHFSFLPTHLSDTFRFGGYSTLFHSLLAWPQIIIRPDSLTYFWCLEFFHLLTTLLAVYYLAWKLFKTRISAIVTTLFSGFIFESYMIYSTLFLIPQTLVAVIFAFLLVEFLEKPKQGLKKAWFSLPFLFLLHYVIGLVAVGILIFASLLAMKRQWFQSKNMVSMMILVILALVIVLSQVNLPLNLEFLNRGEAAAFNYNLEEKIEFLQIFSGNLILIFLPLGILASILSRNTSHKILVFLTLMIIGLVVLNLPYVPKIYVLAHYPVSLLCATGFLLLLNLTKNKLLKGLVLCVLFFVFLPVFISSTSYIKNLLQYPGANTLVSQSEIQAAKYLQKEFIGKNVLLVSDPATQHLLESLTGINSQGGAYADEKTREILIELNQLREPLAIKEKLAQVEDQLSQEKPDVLLFALSGRYFHWQEAQTKEKLDLSFNVWSPKDLSFANLKYVNSLKESDVFLPVFENRTMAVLKTSFE